MRMFKKNFAILTICCIVLEIFGFGFWGLKARALAFQTINEGVLTVGTEAGFPPFEYIDEDGNPTGFDIEFIKAIGEKMGLKVEIQNMDFNSLVASVGTKVDVAIAGMTVTEERKLAVDFSEKYYDAEQYVITRKDSKIRGSSDLSGVTIAAQLGTTGNILADEIVEKYPETILKTYDKFNNAVNDLRAKRIDAIILDKVPARTFEKIYKDELKTIPGDQFDFEIEKYAIAMPKNNPDLQNAINEAIAEVKNDGTYDKILDKYINADISSDSKGLWEQFVSSFVESNRFVLYLNGLLVSIEISVFAAVIGLILGMILALMKIAKNRKGKRPIFSYIADFYIDVIRGTPLVLQLLIMWFIVMQSSKNGILVAALTFGLNSAAYVAEIIRSGILAINKGQMEAGISMGFSKIQTMRYVVLPQALKNSLPSLCNEFISLLKETAIVGYVALSDLTRVANQISSATYQPFMPLIGAALIYFVLIKILSSLVKMLEKRLNKYDIC